MLIIKQVRHLYIGMVLLIIGLNACTDDFTDPNDPKFDNTVEKGVVLHTDQIHQTMHHFGASDGWSTEVIGKNWPQVDKESIGELLFSTDQDADKRPLGIGLSMWRTNIGAGSANQLNNGFASDAWFRATECALSPDGNYDWTQQEGSRWFLKKAKEKGVKYVTGWITSPPYFMTKNGFTFSTPGTGGYNLASDQYDDFVKYLVNYINYYNSQGISIDYLSPVNEPQWSWQSEIGSASQEGSPASNEEIHFLVQQIAEEFAKEQVSTKLIVPEAGDLAFLHSQNGGYPSDQTRAFWDNTSANFIGDSPLIEPIVAGHSYYSNSSVTVALDNRMKLKNRMQTYDVGFWQTEYSILGGDYLEGRSESQLKEIDYALWLTRIMYWDIAHADASGWSFWTSLSYPKWADHKYRFGLINWYPDTENRQNKSGRIEVTKNLWAFGNFSRFVRPGYQRIEVENTMFSSKELQSQNLMIAGFLSPDKKEVVLVMINYSSKDLEVPILNAVKDDELKFVDDELHLYITDQNNNLSPKKIKADELSIKAKSIVTVIGNLM